MCHGTFVHTHTNTPYMKTINIYIEYTQESRERFAFLFTWRRNKSNKKKCKSLDSIIGNRRVKERTIKIQLGYSLVTYTPARKAGRLTVDLHLCLSSLKHYLPNLRSSSVAGHLWQPPFSSFPTPDHF